ncbi:MAG: hypothetical protein QHH18_01140 [Candidatus Bathyarchaeota archaeon]|jgi:hypothetical protein|nr:hypothetical protein [Candidatus Bathyarchaeota archaeon A05DMB-5]MDH7557197.1 hypothetical protein [Candidatus Bathyarchaeota archaeon]
MLGLYENFPKNIHKKAHFTVLVSNKRFQQTLIRTLYEINGKTFNLEEIAYPSVPQCKVVFEWGIADTSDFNYLDEEETSKVLKTVWKKPCRIMDFFCAIRYYKTQNEKEIPLKFDYYMLRFTPNKNLLEIQVFHERGLRYTTPEDIINLIINKINQGSTRKMLKPS